MSTLHVFINQKSSNLIVQYKVWYTACYSHCFNFNSDIFCALTLSCLHPNLWFHPNLESDSISHTALMTTDMAAPDYISKLTCANSPNFRLNPPDSNHYPHYKNRLQTLIIQSAFSLMCEVFVVVIYILVLFDFATVHWFYDSVFPHLFSLQIAWLLAHFNSLFAYYFLIICLPVCF